MRFSSHKRIQSRKPRKSLIHPRTIAAGLLIIALFILLDHAYRSNASTSFLSNYIIQPVSAVHQAKLTISERISRFTSYFTDIDQIEEMQRELEKLRLENIQYQLEMREFESYKEALRYPHKSEFPGITAIVKLRDDRLTEALIINRGKTDGVTVNRPVYSAKGLVGRTWEISENFAKVQPITDPGSRISGYVQGTPYEGILRGTNESDTMILTDLHLIGSGDETITPQPGQTVFTSGTGKVFPRNLAAGVIESTTSDKGIVVKPLVDIQSVRAVIVLTTSTLHDEMLSLLIED